MTKISIALLAFTIAGCAQMDRIIQPRRMTPEERARNMYMGLILLQTNQQVAPSPTIYVIDGRQIVCSQMSNVVTCN